LFNQQYFFRSKTKVHSEIRHYELLSVYFELWILNGIILEWF